MNQISAHQELTGLIAIIVISILYASLWVIRDNHMRNYGNAMKPEKISVRFFLVTVGKFTAFSVSFFLFMYHTSH